MSINSDRSRPPPPLSPKNPRRTGQHPKPLLGTLCLQQGTFSNVDSPEYTDYKHYILFQSWRVAFGRVFFYIDTNIHTNPQMADHDWLLFNRRTSWRRHIVLGGLAASNDLQISIIFFTGSHRCLVLHPLLKWPKQQCLPLKCWDTLVYN